MLAVVGVIGVIWGVTSDSQTNLLDGVHAELLEGAPSVDVHAASLAAIGEAGTRFDLDESTVLPRDIWPTVELSPRPGLTASPGSTMDQGR